MSQPNQGNMLLQAFRTLGIAFLKVIALIFAWCCKLIGLGFIKLSELTFKLTEK